MHERIFELSSKPVARNMRLCLDDIPDSFFNTIADYGDDIEEKYRDEEIKCFVTSFSGLCVRDGDKLTFAPDTCEKLFRSKYSRFLEAAARLGAYSYEAFCGKTGFYQLDMEVFELNKAFEDKFDTYVYNPETLELKSLTAWLRTEDLSKTWYVGGIVDYHW
jgi:hypothetical protein